MAAPGAHKGPPRALLVIIAAAVVVLAGAGTAAAFFFGWFGGGSPADILPGSAVVYVRVDLNPSLSQKLAALQFFRNLPQVEDAASGSDAGSSDPRELLWNMLEEYDTADAFADIDYADDIAPWLGDKAGLALLPPRSGDYSPVTVVAVQVTNADAAKSGLRKLSRAFGADVDVTIRDGYALLTAGDDTDRVLDALEDGTLAHEQAFTDDLRTLGDQGIASAWVDGAGLKRLVSNDTLDYYPGIAGLFRGSAAAALRISADTMELAAVASGLDTELTGLSPSGQSLGDLPASTAMGYGVRGGGDWLIRNWDTLLGFSNVSDVEWQQRYAGSLPISIPDDLATVLGQSINVGLSADAAERYLTRAGGSSLNGWGVGAVVTGDVAAIDDVYSNLVDALGQTSSEPVSLYQSTTGDNFAASPDEQYAGELTDGSPRLSSVDKFTKALPGYASAVSAQYYDLEAIVPSYLGLVSGYGGGDQLDDYRDFLESLRSFGSTVTTTGEGRLAATARVVRS